MTSYVTREEYERLMAKLERLEAGNIVNVSVSGAEVNERVAALVREGIQSAMRDYDRRQDCYPYTRG